MALKQPIHAKADRATLTRSQRFDLLVAKQRVSELWESRYKMACVSPNYEEFGRFRMASRSARNGK
ncbi:MAG TPA: hypothetical protein VNV43_14350 [Candidatus Acidoferrales bacterium]|nr:hypothetical protein [Candidatus Acidoferrales bacterium]